MRKVLLSLLALMTAVAANAFSLRFVNSDLNKNEIISSAVDNPDVLGDGKVSVTFDVTNKTINITMDNATLKSTNAQNVFEVEGDSDYKKCYLNLIGENHIIGASNSSTPIRIQNTALSIQAEDPVNTSLYLEGNTVIVNLTASTAETSLVFGPITETAFDLYVTTHSTNQPVFLGNGTKGSQIGFGLCNLYLTASSANQVTMDLSFLLILGSIQEEGVSIGNNNTFVKDGNPYAGNLTILYPLPVRVNNTWMYPNEAEDFKPEGLKKGKISYDKYSRTLTLDNVELDNNLMLGASNMTVYLKGNNTLTNPDTKTNMLTIYGNGTIKGDTDANLTIYCKSTAKGIYAINGLTIEDFNSLEIYAATIALAGNTASGLDDNKLRITTTPMQLIGSEAVIKDFYDISISSTELEWSAEAEYDKSKKVLMDPADDENIIKSISLRYPVLLSFCDVDVTERNKENIVIPNTSGQAKYDATRKVLFLSDFNSQLVEPNNGIYATDDITIKLYGNNAIATSAEVIYSEGNITIEGDGKLIAQSKYGDGIRIPDEKILTINRRADVTVEAASSAIKCDVLLDCNGGMDPEAEPVGTTAALVIDNASLTAKTATADEYNGAIVGFNLPTLTEAELVEPEGAEFAFKCNGIAPLAGVVKNNTYTTTAVITASGAPSAIVNTKTNTNKVQKTIVNGQMYIVVGENIYNALGSQVK